MAGRCLTQNSFRAPCRKQTQMNARQTACSAPGTTRRRHNKKCPMRLLPAHDSGMKSLACWGQCRSQSPRRRGSAAPCRVTVLSCRLRCGRSAEPNRTHTFIQDGEPRYRSGDCRENRRPKFPDSAQAGELMRRCTREQICDGGTKPPVTFSAAFQITLRAPPS
jgi:hypothetical protein